jgi:hypothetical protein
VSRNPLAFALAALLFGCSSTASLPVDPAKLPPLGAGDDAGVEADASPGAGSDGAVTPPTSADAGGDVADPPAADAGSSPDAGDPGQDAAATADAGPVNAWGCYSSWVTKTPLPFCPGSGTTYQGYSYKTACGALSGTDAGATGEPVSCPSTTATTTNPCGADTHCSIFVWVATAGGYWYPGTIEPVP